MEHGASRASPLSVSAAAKKARELQETRGPCRTSVATLTVDVDALF
jgi:hypothetical protein